MPTRGCPGDFAGNLVEFAAGGRKTIDDVARTESITVWAGYQPMIPLGAE